MRSALLVDSPTRSLIIGTRPQMAIITNKKRQMKKNQQQKAY